MLFNNENTSHIVGYLLWKAGSKMSYLKLLKLVYLADRKALLENGDTLTGDCYVALKLGPVPNFTYNRVKQNQFEPWLECKGYGVRLTKTVNKQDPLETFDLLSENSKSILDCIWEKYGHYTKYNLSQLTHSICPEWEACKNYNIELAHILKAEGYSSKKIYSTLERIAEADRLEAFSNKLR